MAQERESYWNRHHWSILQCFFGAYCAALATWEYFHPHTPSSLPAQNPATVRLSGTGVAMTSNYSMPIWLWLGIVGLALSVVIPAIVNLFRRAPKNAAPSRLKIVEAHYGIEGINDPDVTHYLLERTRGEFFAETVGADLFHGFDPVAGVPKRLKVRYSFDGREATIERPEYSWLILPEDLFLKNQISDLVYQLKANKNQYDSDLSKVRESSRQDTPAHRRM